MRAILFPFRPIGQLLYLFFGGLFVLLVVTISVAALVIAPILFTGYYGAKVGFWLVTVLAVSYESTKRQVHHWHRHSIVGVHVVMGVVDWYVISKVADRYADSYLTFVIDFIWKAIGWIAPTVFGALGLDCANGCKETILAWTRSADVAPTFTVTAAVLSLLGIWVACVLALRDRRRLRMIEAHGDAHA